MEPKKEILILCNNIKLLRKKNNLTKKEMAKICGISVLTLNKIEQGIIPPKVPVDII